MFCEFFLQIIWFMKNRYLNWDKSTYSIFIHQLSIYRHMKHWDDWNEFKKLDYCSYACFVPFPHVPYLMRDETRGGAEHNWAEEANVCSRWVYSSWAPKCNVYLYFPTAASWSVVRLHSAEIAMFSVVSNVYIFSCLVLFIRKAGRYTSSSLARKRASRWTVGSYFQTGWRICAVFIIFCFVL